jgi:hypothetical protein
LVAESAESISPEAAFSCAVIGGITTALGLGIVSIVACAKSNKEIIEKKGIETEGVVLQKETWVTHDDGTGGANRPQQVHHSVTVAYDVDRTDGKRVRITQRRHEITSTKWNELTEGGLVKVKYLPKDPTQNLIVDGYKSGFGMIFGVYKDGFGWVWRLDGSCCTLFFGATLSIIGIGLGLLGFGLAGFIWSLRIYFGAVIGCFGCFGCCRAFGKLHSSSSTAQQRSEVQVDENPSGLLAQLVVPRPTAPAPILLTLAGKSVDATTESERDPFY